MLDVKADAGELEKLLARLKKRARDPSQVMATVSEMLVSAVSDEFDSAGHGTWDPLAESTIAKRRGTSAQILKDTGRFAGSIQGDYGQDYAAAGTDVFYAVFHVSAEPRTIIPLRNPFDIPEARLDEARDTIASWIVGELAA